MRLRPRTAARRGAAMVEAAIILPVFLLIVLGMIDLGIAVHRHQMVSQAARQTSRLAMVRGSMAPPKLAAWGPANYSGVANASHPIAQAVAPRLAGLDPAAVTLKVEWLDGSNEEEKRVRATVTTTYQPMMTYIFGNNPITLTATSTVRITH